MSDAEMKELYDAALLMEAKERGHRAPGFARRSAYRAMLAAEAAAIERFRETFADSNELLRQAMNALGTVDKNDPMEPIADNGMTVWDGMRAESKRLWALYRKHTDDRNAVSASLRTLTKAPDHG